MPRLRAVLSATLAGAAVLAAAAPAQAAALHAVYDASGTTFIKSTKSTVTLAPTKFTADLNTDGTFTGSLPLLPATASFKLIGLLPVTATVTFVSAAPVTGRLFTNPLPAVTSTASYTIKLSNVKVAGLPAFVGNNCATKVPVSITVTTPAGQHFDISSGGTVAGTYTIGQFAHCGLQTPLLNLVIPGSGNTVTFTLSNGVFG